MNIPSKDKLDSLGQEDTSIEDAIIADRKIMLGEIEKTIVHNCDRECWEEIKLLFKRMS